jgi:hypothetical protein
MVMIIIFFVGVVFFLIGIWGFILRYIKRHPIPGEVFCEDCYNYRISSDKKKNGKNFLCVIPRGIEKNCYKKKVIYDYFSCEEKNKGNDCKDFKYWIHIGYAD